MSCISVMRSITIMVGVLAGGAASAEKEYRFDDSDVRQVDVQTAPDVRSRTFRLAGKKDVMDEVKKLNGQFVEVTGLVKRSALDDQGVNIGRRVTMSGGSPSARGTGIPSPANNVPVMDVWSVAPRAGTCPGE